MKTLLLLVAGGTVVYFAYNHYFAGPAQTSPALVPTSPAAVPPATPVPFAIRSAVGNLYNEWKRRELGEKRATLPDPKQLLIEIRRSLFSKGEHAEAAVERAVRQALSEMGIPSGEREHIANGIMSMQ